jgi:hypothetical protein
MGCSNSRGGPESVHEGTRHSDDDGEVVKGGPLSAAESGRLREDNRTAEAVPIARAGGFSFKGRLFLNVLRSLKNTISKGGVDGF